MSAKSSLCAPKRRSRLRGAEACGSAIRLTLIGQLAALGQSLAEGFVEREPSSGQSTWRPLLRSFASMGRLRCALWPAGSTDEVFQRLTADCGRRPRCGGRLLDSAVAHYDRSASSRSRSGIHGEPLWSSRFDEAPMHGVSGADRHRPSLDTALDSSAENSWKLLATNPR